MRLNIKNNNASKFLKQLAAVSIVSVTVITILVVKLKQQQNTIEDLTNKTEFTEQEAMAVLEQYEGTILPNNNSIYGRISIAEMSDVAYSLTDLLSMMYPEKAVYYDSDADDYVFLDINTSLRLNTLDFTKNLSYVGDTNEKQYILPSGEKALKGIDVSVWQGDIDWEKVKADGVQFAYIRAGARGYGPSGTLMTDSRAAENIEECNRVGLPCGVYFYSTAINEKEAIEEAELTLSLIKDYDVSWPIVIDIENAPIEDGRANNLDPETRTKNALAFCKVIEDAGYTPMIYGNLQALIDYLKPEEIDKYGKWFAAYLSRPYYPYYFSIWQYSSKGNIDGIDGDVDLNLAFEDLGKVN